MAIEWGGEAGQSRVRIGIDIEATPNGDGSAYYLKVHFYAQAALSINDNVFLSISGAAGNFNTAMIRMSGTGLYHFHTADHGWQNASFSGGPTHSWGATLGDYYSSPSPSHVRSWTVPARPAGVPSLPTIGVDSITSSSARIVVGAAASDGGSPILGYQVIVGTDGSSLDTIIRTQIFNSGERGFGTVTVTGLQRARGYAPIVRAINAVGYGPFARGNDFYTLATGPDAPTNVQASNIGPDSATLTWSTPANGGSPITGYTVQLSPVSTFASGVLTFTGGDLTGLAPGARYYVRVRAENGAGAGTWSATGSFETLSGAAVKVDGSWRTAKAYVKVDGAWRIAKVWKKVNGAWRI